MDAVFQIVRHSLQHEAEEKDCPFALLAWTAIWGRVGT